MSQSARFLKMAAERLVGGLADNKKDSEFSRKALEQGIKVEREHTDDPKKAKEIAKDHLVEHPKYYAALKQMEEHLEEQEKKAVVIAHIAGPSGAGKTTLLEEIKKTLPDLVVKDLDDFDHEARKLPEFQGKKRSWDAGKLEQLHRHRQKAIDAFITQNADKPIVFGGHHIENSNVTELPTENRYLLDTGPFVSAWRRRKRSAGSSHERTIFDFFKDMREAKEDITALTEAGYQKLNPRSIIAKISDSTNTEKTAALSPEFKPRKHQERALKKIVDSRRLLLAHATGTGKTPLAVAAVEKLKENNLGNKTLVVAPASLKTNFIDAAKKFSDGTIHKGVDGESDYQVISFDALRKDPQGILEKSKADTLVIDEIHRAKDGGSATNKALRQISDKVDNVIGLTGSLVSNHPREIVPLLNIVNPEHDVATSEQSFSKKYLKRTAETYRTGVFSTAKRTRLDIKNKAKLRPSLNKYLDYVSHEEMADQMPGMTVTDVKVPMSPEQNTLYDFAMGSLNPVQRELIRAGLPASQSEASEILARIMKTRQASNAIHTHKDITPEESAIQTPKIKQVIDDVEKHLKDVKDAQAVVYTHFVTGGADALLAGFKKRGIDAGLFAGTGALGTTEESRHQAVKDFKDGKSKVIVLTPAATEGISLNNSTAFFEVDRHYNPEKNQQAIARARRLGGLEHRDKKDRVIEVRRYYSKPLPSFLDKVLGRDPKGVDEWIQTVADEKDRLNQEFRNTVRGKK